MTKFDVMDMAMEAGISDSHFDFQMVSPDELLRFAELVAAKQNEHLQRRGSRLAKLLDEDQWAECEAMLIAAGVTPNYGESSK